MSESKITANHDEISRWTEERQGKPAVVRGTAGKDRDDLGILRIDFPGGAGEESLQGVNWEEWFSKFDGKHPGFLYQDQTSGGQTSRFFNRVARDK